MPSSKKNLSNPRSANTLSANPLPGLVGPFPAESEPPVTSSVNIAPAAAAKLGAEAGALTAPGAEAEAALPGWQSLGKDHKPTHSFGKQGRREKKVRW